MQKKIKNQFSLSLFQVIKVAKLFQVSWRTFHSSFVDLKSLFSFGLRQTLAQCMRMHFFLFLLQLVITWTRSTYVQNMIITLDCKQQQEEVLAEKDKIVCVTTPQQQNNSTIQ